MGFLKPASWQRRAGGRRNGQGEIVLVDSDEGLAYDAEHGVE
jgi:hypothetical protein